MYYYKGNISGTDTSDKLIEAPEFWGSLINGYVNSQPKLIEKWSKWLTADQMNQLSHGPYTNKFILEVAPILISDQQFRTKKIAAEKAAIARKELEDSSSQKFLGMTLPVIAGIVGVAVAALIIIKKRRGQYANS